MGVPRRRRGPPGHAVFFSRRSTWEPFAAPAGEAAEGKIIAAGKASRDSIRGRERGMRTGPADPRETWVKPSCKPDLMGSGRYRNFGQARTIEVWIRLAKLEMIGWEEATPAPGEMIEEVDGIEGERC